MFNFREMEIATEAVRAILWVCYDIEGETTTPFSYGLLCYKTDITLERCI